MQNLTKKPNKNFNWFTFCLPPWHKWKESLNSSQVQISIDWQKKVSFLVEFLSDLSEPIYRNCQHVCAQLDWRVSSTISFTTIYRSLIEHILNHVHLDCFQFDNGIHCELNYIDLTLGVAVVIVALIVYFVKLVNKFQYIFNGEKLRRQVSKLLLCFSFKSVLLRWISCRKISINSKWTTWILLNFLKKLYEFHFAHAYDLISE